MHTEAHLFSVPNACLWYDKLWGPSQRVVTLFSLESYEQDWARGIILLNYIKLAKRVDICDKIASVSSYKML